MIITAGSKLYGNDVLRIRKRLKMTQEEFATALGVTSVTVSNWENTRVLPTKRHVREIMEILSHNLI